MRPRALMAAAFLLTTSLSVPAQTAIPVDAFRSVVVHDSAKVTLRHGPTQRVTLRQGSLQISSVVVDDGALVIRRCREHCPRGYRFEVEITTPTVAAVSILSGGTIKIAGSFPSQEEIDALVSNGGIIDIRSMSARVVRASVESGGGIFIRANQSLHARVHDGGQITYWGRPHVDRSVRGGGAVMEGRAEDLNKPLSELGPQVAPRPPLPPLPPVPPIKR